jgi:PH domain
LRFGDYNINVLSLYLQQEWRRRYFILQGSKLFFCKNAMSGPHGMMDLATCTTVKSADLKSGKRHSFEISTADTCYLLYADTEAEKDDWIGRVGKAIVRCSRTYYNGEGRDGASNSRGANTNFSNQYHVENDDDDIYENDDPDNPYFND